MDELVDGPDPKFWTQFAAVQEALGARGVELEWDPVPGEPRRIPGHVRQKQHVLVPSDDLVAVENRFGHRRVEEQIVPAFANQPELQLVHVGGDNAVQSCHEINQESGRTIATPNHLVSICPLTMCPADEPVPARQAAPFPLPAQDDGGAGVTIRVVDTGLFEGFEVGHPWLADGVTVADEPRKPFLPSGEVKEYAGHGTFVAGVIKAIAPATTVSVSNRLEDAGACMEVGLGAYLLGVLTEDTPPAIISLSAGAKTFDQNAARGFRAFFAALGADNCATLLVAAAGNDGDTRPFYPAAFAAEQDPAQPPRQLSVGALRQDGRGRACFSNYSTPQTPPWVSAYAPGERLVNAFLTGTYSYVDPPLSTTTVPHIPICRSYPEHPLYCTCTCLTAPPQHATVTFAGLAQWSGTSFATPYVAGLVARHMSQTGQTNARVAARELLASARRISDAGDDIPLTVLGV